MEPSIASTDESITIEGTFVDPVMVNFPGSAPVAATVLGSHRVRASVPASASAGDLTVTTCGSTVGPLAFRRATFTLGLGMFEARFDQAGSAQQDVRLVTPRNSHTSTVVGRYLYVLGGAGGNGALNTIEQARLNADGSLGPFATVPVSLVTARKAHTTTVLGNYLYVVGGFGNGSLKSVERAAFGPDGSLGPFATVTDVSLTTARQGHTSAVVGTYLYILGGFGESPLNSVERAIINANGSLSPFTSVPTVTLAIARYGHTAAVIGSYLYVIGGAGSNGTSLQDVERATINPDGSLGPFASVSNATLTIARSSHTTAVVGNQLYVFGGVVGNSSLSSVERAPLGADGLLGSFATVSSVTLTTARYGHTTAVIGNYLYVLGGVGSGSLDNLERAPLNASGSLGLFATIPSSSLVAARNSHTMAVVGNYVYVLGGRTTAGALDSIERATVNADNSLGPFTTVPGVTLAAARYGPTAAVVGNHLYVLGGIDGSGFANSVEWATINADGSLGAFSIMPGATLVTARVANTTAVVGSYLYVLGGVSQNGRLNNLERATINADGSLGAFSTVPGVTLTNSRQDHTSVVIGNYLYILGGFVDDAGVTVTSNGVERAVIAADDSLGAFVSVSGVNLTTGRASHEIAVVGNYLYALGGFNEIGLLNSLERAAIAADGSLGSFMPTPSSTLMTARDLHTIAVIGNDLYVLGGFANGASLNSVEQATITADGSLKALAVSGVAPRTAREEHTTAVVGD
jgi:N-acetylneuraminic acid mutarotase